MYAVAGPGRSQVPPLLSPDRLRARLAAVALVLAQGGACASARNHLDPGGPVYAGGSAADEPVRHTLRVVTFNLKWGREVDRAADLLSRPGPLSDADVLVLQEMDRAGTERLARALGFEWVYVPSAVHPVPKQDFGVAVLSPWPIEDARKLLLPHQSWLRKLRRSAAVATVRSPLGAVRVYAVHFTPPTGGFNGVRRDQARAVLEDAASWPGPVIVAGDFNGRVGAAELAGAGFTWLTEKVKNTMGHFDLDQIVARGLCPAGFGAAAVEEDETHASDHKPVWAVLARCRGPEVGHQATE